MQCDPTSIKISVSRLNHRPIFGSKTSRYPLKLIGNAVQAIQRIIHPCINSIARQFSFSFLSSGISQELIKSMAQRHQQPKMIIRPLEPNREREILEWIEIPDSQPELLYEKLKLKNEELQPQIDNLERTLRAYLIQHLKSAIQRCRLLHRMSPQLEALQIKLENTSSSNQQEAFIKIGPQALSALEDLLEDNESPSFNQINPYNEIVFYNGRFLPKEVTRFHPLKIKETFFDLPDVQRCLRLWRHHMNKTSYTSEVGYAQSLFYCLCLKHFATAFDQSAASFPHYIPLLKSILNHFLKIQGDAKKLYYSEEAAWDFYTYKNTLQFIQNFLLCQKILLQPPYHIQLPAALFFKLCHLFFTLRFYPIPKFTPFPLGLTKLDKVNKKISTWQDIEQSSIPEREEDLKSLFRRFLKNFNLTPRLQKPVDPMENLKHYLMKMKFCGQLFEGLYTFYSQQFDSDSNLYNHTFTLDEQRTQNITRFVAKRVFERYCKRKHKLYTLALDVKLNEIEKGIRDQWIACEQEFRKVTFEVLGTQFLNPEDTKLKLPILHTNSVLLEHDLFRSQMGGLIEKNWRLTPCGRLLNNNTFKLPTLFQGKSLLPFSSQVDKLIGKMDELQMVLAKKPNEETQNALTWAKIKLYQTFLTGITEKIIDIKYLQKTGLVRNKQEKSSWYDTLGLASFVDPLPLGEVARTIQQERALALLNKVYAELLNEYAKLTPPAEPFFKSLTNSLFSFIDDLFGGFFTFHYMTPKELELQKFYADKGYNMTDEITKLIKHLQITKVEGEKASWIEAIRSEFISFTTWAHHHPTIASALLSDLYFAASILFDGQEGHQDILKKIELSLNIQTVFERFELPFDEEIDIESELRYKALADLSRYGPPLASLANQLINSCKRGDVGLQSTISSILKGQFRTRFIQIARDRMAYNNSLSTRALLGLLRGKSLSELVENQAIVSGLALLLTLRHYWSNPKILLQLIILHCKIWMYTLMISKKSMELDPQNREYKERMLVQLVAPFTVLTLATTTFMTFVATGGFWILGLVLAELGLGASLILRRYNKLNQKEYSCYPLVKKELLKGHFASHLREQAESMIENLRRWQGLPKKLTINMNNEAQKICRGSFKQAHEQLLSGFKNKLEQGFKEGANTAEVIQDFQSIADIHAIHKKVKKALKAYSEYNFEKFSYSISYFILQELIESHLRPQLYSALFNRLFTLYESHKDSIHSDKTIINHYTNGLPGNLRSAVLDLKNGSLDLAKMTNFFEGELTKPIEQPESPAFNRLSAKEKEFNKIRQTVNENRERIGIIKQVYKTYHQSHVNPSPVAIRV